MNNLPFNIARKYLFSKKIRNAINIISGISIVSVTIGTMALVLILSVFNGFESLINSMYTAFDPDIKITIKEGKVFEPDNEKIIQVTALDFIESHSEVCEDMALLKHQDQQYIAVVKGIDDSYKKTTNIDSLMYRGNFVLYKGNSPFAIIGRAVAYYLGTTLEDAVPISVFVPKRKGTPSMNLATAFNKKLIFPGGIFAVEQEIDSKYIFIPIDMARSLYEYTNEVTSIDMKIKSAISLKKAKSAIEKILGDEYVVQTRYEQNETFYKVMESEKWAIFFILVFILAISSFNTISSLTMVMLEKRQDINVLYNMGANKSLINKIFLYEGWMITAIGAITGIIMGLALALLQQYFGIIKLSGSGAFIIDAYPVHVQYTDLIFVMGAIGVIGFVAAWIPIKTVGRKLLNK